MNARLSIVFIASLALLIAAGCENGDTPPSGSAGLTTPTPDATSAPQSTPRTTITATPEPASTVIATATREPPPAPQPTVEPEPTTAATPTATPVQAAGSGIQGQALMGPMCPVVSSDEPCPDQPVRATVDVLNVDCTQKITTFTTDADGRFRVDLQPGEYCLIPQPGTGGFPFGTPQNVVVRESAYTAVVISLDTGIR